HLRRQPTSGPTSDGKDRRVDRREAATEGQSRQKCCGQSGGKEIPGLSNQPRGPNRSGTAESPKAQGQSTKTVAKLPKLNERRAQGALVRLRAGMVGILPPSRSYPSGFSTGTLDSETDAQMLLAALARQERAQEETPTAGYPRSGAQDRFQRSGSLAGGQVSHAPSSTIQQNAAPLRLLTTIRARGPSAAGFNRRMLKTACPVVWEGHGAQSPCPDPIHDATPATRQRDP